MVLFDYLFYRATAFYERHEGGPAWFSGVLVVTALQTIGLYDCLLIAGLLGLRDPFKSIPTSYHNSVIVAVEILILLCNVYRYRRIITYAQLAKRWKDENPKARRRRSWMITAEFVVTIGFLVSLVILKHNLHWI